MKPINIIQKLNESADVCSDEFKERLRNIFGSNVSITDNTKSEFRGCVIGDTGICINDQDVSPDGQLVDGIVFFVEDYDALIPDIGKGGTLNIMAPRFIKSKNGTEYGDSYSFTGDLSDEEIKDICYELSSKIVHLKDGVRDDQGYGVIDEDNLNRADDNSVKSNTSYYIIGEKDFQKLLKLNGGAFDSGYLVISTEEANELANKQDLNVNDSGIFSNK